MGFKISIYADEAQRKQEHMAQMMNDWYEVNQEKLSPLELKEAFIDGLTDIVPAKIQELRDERRELIELIETRIKEIKQETKDGERREMFYHMISLTLGKLLLQVEKELDKFYRYQKLLSGSVDKEDDFSEKKERAKEADIVDVIAGTVRLHKSGSKFVGLCPFHQEKTPSFTVFPAKKYWRCFGCQESGDVIQFVQKINNIGFVEAVNILS